MALDSCGPAAMTVSNQYSLLSSNHYDSQSGYREKAVNKTCLSIYSCQSLSCQINFICEKETASTDRQIPTKLHFINISNPFSHIKKKIKIRGA